jgi:hypothetical protein
MVRRIVNATFSMGLGMLLGLGAGVLLTLWVLFVYLQHGDAPFAAKHTTLPFTVALYLGGGVVAGGIAGLLGPLGRGRAWAAMVGYLSALPVSAALGVFGGLGGRNPWLVVGLTALIGLPVGVIYRQMFGDLFAVGNEDGPAI